MAESYNMDGEEKEAKRRLSPVVIVTICIVVAAIGAGVGIGIGYGIFHKDESTTAATTAPTTQPIPTKWAEASDQIRLALLPGGNLNGVFYGRLANFTDSIGPRLIGTEAYKKGVDYVVEQLTNEKFDNVHTEWSDLAYGQWLRGEETLTLLQPLHKTMAVLGLGWTRPTPPEGIEADVIVIRSRDELDMRAKEVEGKIVVFNPDWTGYGNFVRYRVYGATWAANYSAKAVLVRSAASKSAYNPHTGNQKVNQDTNLSDIPAAAITVEDAALLDRLQQMGRPIRLHLTLQSQHAMKNSSGQPFQIETVVADLTGSEKPEEIVLVSGHLDSWDVGEGAMDDADGVFLSWMVLTTLKSLNLKPKRTIRAVFWAGEETGGFGATKYYLDHNSTSEKYVFVMESDMGVFKSAGIQFTGNDTAAQIMVDSVLPYLQPINASTLVKSKNVGSDLDYWLEDGIPGAEPLHENYDQTVDYYFTYHHSNADMMNVLNSDHLDLTSIMYTTIAYVIADMDKPLPLNMSYIAS